jgi:hypothetical protein
MIDSNTKPQLAKGLHKRHKRPLQQYDCQTIMECDTDNVKKKVKKENGVNVELQVKDHEQELTSFKDDTLQPSNTTYLNVNSNADILFSATEIPATSDMDKTMELLAVNNNIANTSAIEPPSTPMNDDGAPSSPSCNKKKRKKAKSQHQNSDAQAQLQEQLQNTIRQHLLDPVLYPLPPSIAQLLPQAIAQLPPQLATQLSSSVQKSIATKTNDFESVIASTETVLVEPSIPKEKITSKDMQREEVVNSVKADASLINSMTVQKKG